MKYRKKPVVIEAERFTGSRNSADQLANWIVNMGGSAYFDNTGGRLTVHIVTLEGVMEASPGDWIIRGVQGEFYPCKPNIFEATYEPAKDEQ